MLKKQLKKLMSGLFTMGFVALLINVEIWLFQDLTFI